MAIRYAVANGDWSNTSTWDGGTLPAAGDEIFSNNFRVNIDVATFSAVYLSNGSLASPAINAGGGFTIEQSTEYTGDLRWHNASNITANDLFRISGTGAINVIWTGTFVWAASGTIAVSAIWRLDNPNATCVINGTGTFERPPLGQNVATVLIRQISGDLTINANTRTFGSVANQHTLLAGTSDLTGLPPLKTTWNGNIIQEGTGTSGNGTKAISIGGINRDGLEFNFNGDITQTSIVAAIALDGVSSDTITINHIGDIDVNNAGIVAFLASTINNPNLVWNWTGNITRTLAGVLTISGSGVRNITTNLAFVLTTANDIINIGSSVDLTINFSGNMTGGNVASARAFNILTTATRPVVNIFGNLTGGDFSPATAGRYDTGAYALLSFCLNAYIGGSIVAIGSTFDSPAMFVLNTTECFIEKAITGASPSFSPPYIGRVRFKTTEPEFQISLENNTTLNLVSPELDDYPAERDVRLDIDYAFESYTGTLAVPTYSQVSLGVPTDDGFGTGIISAEDFENFMNSSTASIVERLRNVATVENVGDGFETF